MAVNVLLVEDDIDLASTIVDYFALEAISCDHASNGARGLSLIESNDYQVLVLDINLPKIDGLLLCEKLRALGNDTPTLMLTARDSLSDKIAGFNAGADDYLVKPFEIEELLARVMVLSKRRSGQVATLNVGKLELQLKECSANFDGVPIKLTQTTFKLLKKLMLDFSKPISRAILMQTVWGEDQPDSNSLKVHIHHLRKQLKKANCDFSIDSVPGFGFVLRTQ